MIIQIHNWGRNKTLRTGSPLLVLADCLAICCNWACAALPCADFLNSSSLPVSHTHTKIKTLFAYKFSDTSSVLMIQTWIQGSKSERSKLSIDMIRNREDQNEEEERESTVAWQLRRLWRELRRRLVSLLPYAASFAFRWCNWNNPSPIRLVNWLTLFACLLCYFTKVTTHARTDADRRTRQKKTRLLLPIMGFFHRVFFYHNGLP